MSNMKQSSVLRLLDTYTFKATTALVFLYPSRDPLCHRTSAKARHEVIVHTKVQTVKIISSLSIIFSFSSPFWLIFFSISMSQDFFFRHREDFCHLITSVLPFQHTVQLGASSFSTSSASSPMSASSRLDWDVQQLNSQVIRLLYRSMPSPAEFTCKIMQPDV